MRGEKLTPGICCHCGVKTECGFVRCRPCAKEFKETRGARVFTNLGSHIPSRTEAEIRWRALVGRATKIAIRAGFLPEPSDCNCADCNRQAECFDHPDYNRPLYVVPVCLSCNSVRRRGVMPEVQTVESLREAHAIGVRATRPDQLRAA